MPLLFSWNTTGETTVCMILIFVGVENSLHQNIVSKGFIAILLLVYGKFLTAGSFIGDGQFKKAEATTSISSLSVLKSVVVPVVISSFFLIFNPRVVFYCTFLHS